MPMRYLDFAKRAKAARDLGSRQLLFKEESMKLFVRKYLLELMSPDLLSAAKTNLAKFL